MKRFAAGSIVSLGHSDASSRARVEHNSRLSSCIEVDAVVIRRLVFYLAPSLVWRWGGRSDPGSRRWEHP